MVRLVVSKPYHPNFRTQQVFNYFVLQVHSLAIMLGNKHMTLVPPPPSSEARTLKDAPLAPPLPSTYWPPQVLVGAVNPCPFEGIKDSVMWMQIQRKLTYQSRS